MPSKDIMIKCEKCMKDSVISQLKLIQGFHNFRDGKNENEFLVQIKADTDEHLENMLAFKIRRINSITDIAVLS